MKRIDPREIAGLDEKISAAVMALVDSKWKGVWDNTPEDLLYSEYFDSGIGEFTGDGTQIAMSGTVGGTPRPPYTYAMQAYGYQPAAPTIAQLDMNALSVLSGRTLSRLKVWYAGHANSGGPVNSGSRWTVFNLSIDGSEIDSLSAGNYYDLDVPWHQVEIVNPPKGVFRAGFHTAGFGDGYAGAYMAIAGFELYSVPVGWDGYKSGEFVLHQGDIWESTKDNNLDTPGVSGWIKRSYDLYAGDGIKIEKDHVNQRTVLTSSFPFVQATPASEWVVNHNLGRYPSVVVRCDSDGGEECDTAIYHNSKNQLTISFPSPESGTADCN